MDGQQREPEHVRFHQWFRRMRQRDGRSAEALSIAAGLEKSYVSRLEAGQIKRPQLETWRPLARELRIPDAVMAAAVGGFLPDDAAQPLEPPRPPAPWPDPALVARIKKGLRDLGVTLPDDQLTQGAVALAAMEGHWKSRAEIEATEGPIGEPPTLDPPSRDARGAG